jgi:hypothetical protein
MPQKTFDERTHAGVGDEPFSAEWPTIRRPSNSLLWRMNGTRSLSRPIVLCRTKDEFTSFQAGDEGPTSGLTLTETELNQPYAR